MHIEKEKGAMPIKLNFSRPVVVNFLLVAGSFLAARALVFDAASPFALAYISTFLFRGAKFYGASLFASLGIITSFRSDFSMKYLLAIVLLCLANLFLSLRPKMAAPFVQAAAVAFAAVLSGIVLMFIRGQGAYHFAVNLLEAALIFALAIVLSKGIACVAPRAKRRALSNEELIALTVLAGVLAVGASDVLIWQFSMRHFLAILIVLLAAQSGGASIGAVCGVFLGFLLNMTGFEYIYFAVLLSAAGFAAGSTRGYGRLASILAFVVVGALCALYFDLTLLTWGLLLSATAAAMAFYFLPPGLLLNIHSTVNPATGDSDEYMRKAKSRVVSRVYDFAAGYSRLASVFNGRSLSHRKISTVRPDALVEAMKTEFCEGCHRHDHCWDEKSAEMSGYIKTLADKSERAGKIGLEDAPFGLTTTCIAPVDFIRALWAQIGRQHMAKDLQQRLAEARTLVAQQFSGLSLVMYEFASELDATLNFRKELENKVIGELEKLRIEVENVIVIENRRGKCEISLSTRRTDDPRLVRDIGTALSHVAGRRMELVEERFEGRMVRMEFFERHKYYVHSGIAKAGKGGLATESGDSFSLVQLRDGRCVAALSDGMGSGKRAKDESEMAIELLEELMERGFEQEITLRLINSALLMKSGDESFSTLDICVLDMNTGHAEFIKIGAATSYLLRHGEATAIGSWTLPVGILDNIDIDVQQKQLAHGDIIVMMTDGVADSHTGAARAHIWVEGLLEGLPTGNPQDIADEILAVAQANYGDEAGDDMTVLVLRVLERG